MEKITVERVWWVRGCWSDLEDDGGRKQEVVENLNIVATSGFQISNFWFYVMNLFLNNMSSHYSDIWAAGDEY